MELGLVVFMIVVSAISVGVGIMIGIALGKNKRNTDDVCGVVHVDCSDPTFDAWLYLEASVSISEIASRHQVTFDVNVIE